MQVCRQLRSVRTTEAGCKQSCCTCMCDADAKGKHDELVEDKGVKVLIEPAAIMHVIGTRMNFVQDSLR